MPDDKGGSDLDVFEGLGTKPAAPSQQGAPLPEPTPPPSKAPAPRPTERGGYGSPSTSGRGLPPPSKVPSRRGHPSGPGVDLPKPKPPPSKATASAPVASQPVALPKPKPPPGKGSGMGGPEAPSAHVMRNSPSDAPEVEVGTDFRGKVFDEASSPGSILPGGVAADLNVLRKELQELYEAKRRATTGRETQDRDSSELAVRGK